MRDFTTWFLLNVLTGVGIVLSTMLLTTGHPVPAGAALYIMWFLRYEAAQKGRDDA